MDNCCLKIFSILKRNETIKVIFCKKDRFNLNFVIIFFNFIDRMDNLKVIKIQKTLKGIFILGFIAITNLTAFDLTEEYLEELKEKNAVEANECMNGGTLSEDECYKIYTDNLLDIADMEVSLVEYERDMNKSRDVIPELNLDDEVYKQKDAILTKCFDIADNNNTLVRECFDNRNKMTLEDYSAYTDNLDKIVKGLETAN